MIKIAVLRTFAATVIAACASGAAMSEVTASKAPYNNNANVQKFIDTFAETHNYDKKSLENLFFRVEPRQDILDLISRPAEGKPWHEYRKIFIVDRRIEGGVAFYNENRAALTRAEAEYGVPAEIITAIIGVETLYGKHAGKHRVIDALSTLGFDYPPRSKYFRGELEQFLLLTREQKIDPFSLKGSYAGAMGIPQFMPTSYRTWAIDYDNDGVKDLWHNPTDAIGSVANYFVKHRWLPGGEVASLATKPEGSVKHLVRKSLKPDRTMIELRKAGLGFDTAAADDDPAMLIELDQPDGKEYWIGFHNFYAITRYNHSALYAMAVYQLSQEIKKKIQ